MQKKKRNQYKVVYKYEPEHNQQHCIIQSSTIEKTTNKTELLIAVEWI